MNIISLVIFDKANAYNRVIPTRMFKQHYMSSLEPLKSFLFSRALILIIAILASQIHIQEHPAREGRNYHMYIDLHANAIITSLEKIARSADASWYIDIASNGYHKETSPASTPRNWTFFPLFPLLMRAFKPICGSYLFAGLLISNVCFLLALIYTHRLQTTLGYSTASADRTTWLISLFPVSYFFSVPLTESLFFLLTVLTFYSLHKRKHMLAGLLMCLVVATRPTGALLIPAFVFILYEHKAIFTLRGLCSLALTPLGILCFMWVMYSVTSNPLAFYDNQLVWGRGKTGFLELLTNLARNPGNIMIDWNFTLLNLMCALIALGASGYFVFKRHYSWTIFILTPTIFALHTGTLQSMSRFVMVMFPVFFAVSELIKNASRERFALLICTTLLALMCAMYALHVTSAMA